MNILWMVTGGGYLLEESCRALESLSKRHTVTVAFSRAGREVALMYNLFGRFKRAAKKVVCENDEGYSSPLVGRLGLYDLVVLSPCTANTVAKIVLGVADSLASNVCSQALKSGRMVAIVPTDSMREVDAVIPSGRKIRISCRDVDIRNARKLKAERDIKVLKSPSDISRLLKDVD
ncbi:MAG: flavoprotein [Candidatus Altiarchaeota archaeon]|nr:flavoprotein [Candidatus Altiarchaeota archaeon]